MAADTPPRPPPDPGPHSRHAAAVLKGTGRSFVPTAANTTAALNTRTTAHLDLLC